MFQIAAELTARPSCNGARESEVRELDRVPMGGVEWATGCVWVLLLHRILGACAGEG